MSISFDKLSSYEGVVLDIDSTLLYSTESKKDITCLEKHSISFMGCTGKMVKANVYLRPYVKELLTILCQRYSVGIWSFGQPNYIRAIATILDIGTSLLNPTATNKVAFIYDWTHAHRENYTITKPLRLSPFKDIKALIIEDKISSCDLRDSYIIVPAFKGQKDDTCLKTLLNHF